MAKSVFLKSEMFLTVAILKCLKEHLAENYKSYSSALQEGAASEMTPVYIQQCLNDVNSTKNNYTKALIIHPLFR